jgi:DNA-binding NarL/FixJ family response regulator
LRAAWEKLVRSFTACWVAGSYMSFDDFYVRSNGYPFDVFLVRVEDSWAINWNDLRNIRSQKPNAGIVVLLNRTAIRFAPVAVQQGAHAVVCTAADPQELHDAIQSAAGGNRYLCKLATSALNTIAEEERAPRRDQLSTREADVLALTARGLRLKEIAEQLGVNSKTAYSYRTRAMQKLGLQNTAQVIRYALESANRDSSGNLQYIDPQEPVELVPDEDD